MLVFIGIFKLNFIQRIIGYMSTDVMFLKIVLERFCFSLVKPTQFSDCFLSWIFFISFFFYFFCLWGCRRPAVRRSSILPRIPSVVARDAIFITLLQSGLFLYFLSCCISPLLCPPIMFPNIILSMMLCVIPRDGPLSII